MVVLITVCCFLVGWVAIYECDLKKNYCIVYLESTRVNNKYFRIRKSGVANGIITFVWPFLYIYKSLLVLGTGKITHSPGGLSGKLPFKSCLYSPRYLSSTIEHRASVFVVQLPLVSRIMYDTFFSFSGISRPAIFLLRHFQTSSLPI